jgi:hypothetical protein
MSTTPSQSESPDTDELVAYLDGELSADDCRRVEKRLANDAEYRRRLTELEQAWSVLEVLPSTKVDEDFARTTIEMVAVAAEREARADSATQSILGRRKTYWWAAAGAAFAVAAFVLARLLWPSPNRALVADLPVIANLDVLTQVGSVEYLRGLSKLNFETSLRNEDAIPSVMSTSEWESAADRRAWIEALAPEKKASLASKFERFERLAPAPQAQDALRELSDDIATASDREQLERTLVDYGAWIERLSPGRQLELREASSTEKRIQLVERMLEQSDREARRQLSPEDEKRLQDVILDLVEERRGELLQEIGRQGHSDPERRLGGRPAAQVALVIIGRDMLDDERRTRTVDRLTAPLSPEAQEYLNEQDRGQRVRQLMRWVYEAVGSNVQRQNLEQFFTNELTNDQREYLLGLPSTEMREQLEQLYMRSQVGLRDDDFLRRFWRGRGPWGERDRDRDGGRGDRGRRDGPRDEFERERFDGPPPFPPGGPSGRGGRPPGPPPRDRRDFGPPPRDGMGPPPHGEGPPREEPI